MNDPGSRGPIFLVGCPRSGTTLLQRLLDAHSEISIAPETFFVRRFWKARRNYGDLRNDENLWRLLNDVVAIPEFGEMELSEEEFRSAAVVSDRSYGSLFRILLTQFARRRETPWVGEKTPNHLLYMRTLERFFAGARFIHIVRDPRAVAESWRHVPWTNGSLGADAEIWRKYMAAARTRPPLASERLLTLHYEDLVANPERELTVICAFLGLAFQRPMLGFHEQIASGLNVQREPWKQGATMPVTPEPVERWRQRLTNAEIREIEGVAWPELARAGYHPEHHLIRVLPTAVRSTWRRHWKNLRRKMRR